MVKISRNEALAAGSNKYFTGTPCRNGHIAERYTSSGTCSECINGTSGRPSDKILAEGVRLRKLGDLKNRDARLMLAEAERLRVEANALNADSIVLQKEGADLIARAESMKIAEDVADSERAEQVNRTKQVRQLAAQSRELLKTFVESRIAVPLEHVDEVKAYVLAVAMARGYTLSDRKLWVNSKPLQGHIYRIRSHPDDVATIEAYAQQKAPTINVEAVRGTAFG